MIPRLREKQRHEQVTQERQKLKNISIGLILKVLKRRNHTLRTTLRQWGTSGNFLNNNARIRWGAESNVDLTINTRRRRKNMAQEYNDKMYRAKERGKLAPVSFQWRRISVDHVPRRIYTTSPPITDQGQTLYPPSQKRDILLPEYSKNCAHVNLSTMRKYYNKRRAITTWLPFGSTENH